MKICRLEINNFRGVQKADILLPMHAVLIGDNNTGKTTILEAIDLVLGPDRLNRTPPIDEHDFFQGKYWITPKSPAENAEESLADTSEVVADETDTDQETTPQIRIEVTITDLSQEQQAKFGDYAEWWDENGAKLYQEQNPAGVDVISVVQALRVTFVGLYDESEDDFIGKTYYTRSLLEEDNPVQFHKKDKQICGFLYLRSLRTGSRALSLERGSLLDIILRLKEVRPHMWEDTIENLAEYSFASDPELGISGVLESINTALKKYVPKEWGIEPHLKVSNLTREHLRKVITAFIATGEGDHAAPFYRQGTGTINMLVLAMLSQIAESKQNVIFAMEEPEIAIPPYAQKRIVHEIRNLASQALFTSHSPYVLEEFSLDETVVLSRDSNGVLSQNHIVLPESVKLKRYRQEFRTRFCEGLLTRRILVAEGATEASAFPVVCRRLAELNPDAYSSLEALGICTIDAGGETNIPDVANLYRNLGKRVFAICDKQKEDNKVLIEAQVELLLMHDEKGFENLVLNNTTEDALKRFSEFIDGSSSIKSKYKDLETSEAIAKYFRRTKANWGVADFLAQCNEQEVPEWLRNACQQIKNHFSNLPAANTKDEATTLPNTATENQQRVMDTQGHLLVTGGPGSGKTTIAILKASQIAERDLFPGQKVLFLSFARATVSRVIEAIDYEQQIPNAQKRRIEVQTYHSFFWRILKTHGYLIGLPRRIDILTPPKEAILLAELRSNYAADSKLDDVNKQEKARKENGKRKELASEQGFICFDLFAPYVGDILCGSAKIRKLLATMHPVIILDEFQDTNEEQWRVVKALGEFCTLLALADPEQRIYDWIGADPERLNKFINTFEPTKMDLGTDNHRSTNTDIVLFGNDILSGNFQQEPYNGIQLLEFEPDHNRAMAKLITTTYAARKRLINKKNWSLAILVPTKRMTRIVSYALSAPPANMKGVPHIAAIELEAAILAAEIVAFLMQPDLNGLHLKQLIDLLQSYFHGKGGDSPTKSDIEEADRLRKSYEDWTVREASGKEIKKNSILVATLAVYAQVRALTFIGDPDQDWRTIRDVLEKGTCKRMKNVAEEVRNIRLLDRGTQIRQELSQDWRDNGVYSNALEITRHAFVREHFSTNSKPETGVIVMNMHKAKGKQFDEVIIFEGWPRTSRGEIVANFDRIVRRNDSNEINDQARYNLRVSVTRGKLRTTILTPKNDPCVLLPSRV